MSALNDTHPSLNMSLSQTFSVILMHSHHTHDHALWDGLMHSHTLSCMWPCVNQHRMTHPPWTWAILRHSQTFSDILMHYQHILGHSVWDRLMHCHTSSCMLHYVNQPRMTHPQLGMRQLHTTNRCHAGFLFYGTCFQHVGTDCTIRQGRSCLYLFLDWA